MQSEEFFLIRPRSELASLLVEAGEEPFDEFSKPVIWTQQFDLRTTGRADAALCVETSVKIKFLAYAASQLPAAFGKDFERLTPEVFDRFWTVEWLKGGMLEEAEIYGDLTEDVVSRMAIGALDKDSALGAALNHVIERMRSKAGQVQPRARLDLGSRGGGFTREAQRRRGGRWMRPGGPGDVPRAGFVGIDATLSGLPNCGAAGDPG